jgi:hypothetical protein
MTHYLRIYDDRSDAPQPIGPLTLDVPEDASDDEITEAIRREADSSRRYAIHRRHGSINPGWQLVYYDDTSNLATHVLEPFT